MTNSKFITKQKGFKKHVINNPYCMECKRYTRHFHTFENKFICYTCYRKHQKHIIGFNNGFTLEEALNKVYKVRGYLTKQNYMQSVICTPSVLTGRKVKLVLVDNLEVENERKRKS